MAEKPPISKILNSIKRDPDYASGHHGTDHKVYKPIDCGLGSSPFGYPEEVDLALKQISPNLLNEYPADPYSRGLAGLVRERFGLRKSTSIFFGGTGSYGLLASLLSDVVCVEAIAKGVEVVGVGPQFTNISMLSRRAQIPYHHIAPKIDLPYEEKIDLLIRRRAKATSPAIVYVDNPNNPTGDAVNMDTLYKLTEATAGRDLLIIDEAYGDALPDVSSAFRLADQFEHVVALRSLSKTVGLASPRLGYMAMSGLTAEAYKNLELIFSLDTVTNMIGRAALEPAVLARFLPQVRQMTASAKLNFVRVLNDHGVKTFGSHPSVSILLARAGQDFFNNLLQVGIQTENGQTFKPTHPDMTNRYVRFRIPACEQEAEEIGRRIDDINSKSV